MFNLDGQSNIRSHWVFEISEESKPSVIIIEPLNNDIYAVGSTLSVSADIKNTKIAKLKINKYTEIKENLINKNKVNFDDYIITDNDIGELYISIEVESSLKSFVNKIEIKVSVNDLEDGYITLEQMLQVKANNLSWNKENIRDLLTWDTTIYIPTYTERSSINQNDIDVINNCLKKYDITGAQIPHFIAQCSHECGCVYMLIEN